ncbi:hypothetical protein HK097_005537 [Rhizophlyctis rosea]|uniref:Major facilitator superfamily (MFS) profile domain-containing protein n=1 Tax=Rhizophlyctis rosea TaxID=64517 RepID=A0AAD5SKD4_9FUNG|nr:hypothetical protein HK097_005537 [Rhizophlyctis rosea]
MAKSATPTSAEGQGASSPTEQTPLLTTFPSLNESETPTQTGYSLWQRYRQTPSPYLIVPPLFIHVFSSSLAITPTQQFLLVYLCGYLHPDGGAIGASSWLPPGYLFKDPTRSNIPLPSFEQCRQMEDVQVLTARWTLTLSLAATIPALISVPLYGVLLDRIGRRPILMIPIVSAFLGLLALISVAQFGMGPYVLLVSNFLQGCMGSIAVLVMATFAYIADTTTPNRRTQTFVYVEAALFVGLTAGPFCGGVLSRVMPQGVIGVFYVAAVGKLVALLYVFLLLPESLKPSAPSSTSTSPTPPQPKLLTSLLTSLRGTLELFSVSGPSGHATRILIVIFFVLSCAFGSFGIYFFYMASRFGWDSYDEGVFMLVLSIARTAWMVGFLPWLMKVLVNRVVPVEGPEQKERRVRVEVWVTRAALGVLVAGYVLLGLATKTWMIFAITIADGFGTVTRPNLRGLLSRTVPNHLQGRLFSGTQLVEQVGTLVSGIMYPSLWAHTVKSFPSAFFFLTSSLYFLAFLLACYVKADGLNVELLPEKAEGEGEEGGSDVEENATLVATAVVDDRYSAAP